jgi:hypothetical protein
MRYNAFDGGPLDDDEPCDCDNCEQDREEEDYLKAILAEGPPTVEGNS